MFQSKKNELEQKNNFKLKKVFETEKCTVYFMIILLNI